MGEVIASDSPSSMVEHIYRAAYLNHNDLGFGRDMHCLRNGQDVACWVTNYGTPDFGPDTGYTYPDNADLAAARSGPRATVTMEFTDVPAEPGRRFVTFYAYGGGTGTAPRIDAIDLLAYRDLNERVRDYTAPSAAISELLDGWYGPLGSPKPGPGPDLSFVPARLAAWDDGVEWTPAIGVCK